MFQSIHDLPTADYIGDLDTTQVQLDENSLRYVGRSPEEFRRDAGSATEGRNLVRPYGTEVVLRNVVEVSDCIVYG